MGAPGEPRSPIDLMVDTANAVAAAPVPYLLSGLGVAAVLFPLVIGVFVVPYLALVLGVAAGSAGGDEGLGALLGMGGFALALLVAILLITVVTQPLYASLMRAIWLYQENPDDTGALGLGAPFSSATQGVVPVLVVTALIMTLSGVGALFCVLPALVVGAVCVFAVPAVVIDGLAPVAAVQRSVAHARANPGWHLGVYFVHLGIVWVIAQVPFIGYVAAGPIGYDYLLRAYREACAVNPDG